MPRVKGGFKTRRRRNKWLARSKGYQSVSNNVYKKSRERVEYALNQSYKGRKVRKRDFRSLWTVRIGAAAKLNGTNYSTLIGALHKNQITLNRKVLSEMAIHHPEHFAAVCDKVKS